MGSLVQHVLSPALCPVLVVTVPAPVQLRSNADETQIALARNALMVRPVFILLSPRFHDGLPKISRAIKLQQVAMSLISRICQT
jgi:hypothetical protein